MIVLNAAYAAALTGSLLSEIQSRTCENTFGKNSSNDFPMEIDKASYKLSPAYFLMVGVFLLANDSVANISKTFDSPSAFRPPHLNNPAAVKAAPINSLDSFVSLNIVS